MEKLKEKHLSTSKALQKFKRDLDHIFSKDSAVEKFKIAFEAPNPRLVFREC